MTLEIRFLSSFLVTNENCYVVFDSIPEAVLSQNCQLLPSEIKTKLDSTQKNHFQFQEDHAFVVIVFPLPILQMKWEREVNGLRQPWGVLTYHKEFQQELMKSVHLQALILSRNV